MIPFILRTPREMALALAERVRQLRLQREWTQEELAARSGVAIATYRRFERTGEISLARLLKIAVILDAQDGFEDLFRLPPARSIAELERQWAGPTRQRGRRRDAKT
jgi:transcriptional regulator with XRE-family HTH domain